jgi:peptide chain release factor 1
MIPLKTVEELINKHSVLERDLSSGKIDKKFFAEKSKEYSDLNEIIQDAKKYMSYEKNRSEIQKILDDKNSDTELIKMAEIELNDLKL